MSNENSNSGTEENHSQLWSAIAGVNIWIVRGAASLLTVSLLLVLASTVAVATEPYDFVLQTDVDEEGFMCEGTDPEDQTFLGEILDTILTLITVSAIPVFIILYQLDGLMEFFALGADTKAKIKKHQRNMWIGAAKIFLAPAIISVVAEALEIGIPECVSVMPW